MFLIIYAANASHVDSPKVWWSARDCVCPKFFLFQHFLAPLAVCSTAAQTHHPGSNELGNVFGLNEALATSAATLVAFFHQHFWSCACPASKQAVVTSLNCGQPALISPLNNCVLLSSSLSGSDLITDSSGPVSAYEKIRAFLTISL